MAPSRGGERLLVAVEQRLAPTRRGACPCVTAWCKGLSVILTIANSAGPLLDRRDGQVTAGRERSRRQPACPSAAAGLRLVDQCVAFAVLGGSSITPNVLILIGANYRLRNHDIDIPPASDARRRHSEKHETGGPVSGVASAAFSSVAD